MSGYPLATLLSYENSQEIGSELTRFPVSSGAIPYIGAGDKMPLIISTDSMAHEIVLGTGYADGVLTVLRGQEQSSPMYFPVGSYVYSGLPHSVLRSKISGQTQAAPDGQANVVLANNARGKLAGGIVSSDLILRVRASDAVRFPSVTTGNFWFPLVLRSPSGSYEAMRCTRCTNGALTVERAQEGTSALEFPNGSDVFLALTSSACDQLTNRASIEPDTYTTDPNLVLGNYAASLLDSPLLKAGLTASLKPGHGARFPALTGAQWYPVTLTDIHGNVEYARAVGLSGDTLTLVRARENSKPRDFPAGSLIDLRITRSVIHALQGWSAQEASDEQGL